VSLHRADAVTADITAELHRKRARAEGRKRLSDGPRRAMGPTRASTFWWYLHLSRLTIRVMLQAAHRDGRALRDIESWAHLDRAWTEGLRRFAERAAMHRCKTQEPEEYAKLARIPEQDGAARAVFLSRYLKVPKPGEVGPATWEVEDLRELARWVAHSVDEDSAAWPHHPDGWRESLELLREGVEQR
jgi:hypothetical protein